MQHSHLGLQREELRADFINKHWGLLRWLADLLSGCDWETWEEKEEKAGENGRPELVYRVGVRICELFQLQAGPFSSKRDKFEGFERFRAENYLRGVLLRGRRVRVGFGAGKGQIYRV